MRFQDLGRVLSPSWEGKGGESHPRNYTHCGVGRASVRKRSQVLLPAQASRGWLGVRKLAPPWHLSHPLQNSWAPALLPVLQGKLENSRYAETCSGELAQTHSHNCPTFHHGAHAPGT